MNRYTQISIISTAETALKKLNAQKIAVHGCKKSGAEFIFAVKDKDIKKVFAIFAKPCYNIRTVKKSAAARFRETLKLRAGLAAGAVLFAVIAALSNSFILKIEVSGSGKYLESEVRRIVYDEGAGELKRFSSLNKAVATGKILSLPQVTFCNISQKGSVLVVDVQVDGEYDKTQGFKELVSDCNGKVKNIVAVCGTCAVQAGDSVKKGDTLIYAHYLRNEEKVSCLAAGYAEIECAAVREYFADCESEQNLKEAYASLLVDEENILSRTHKVKPVDGGVNYIIEFTYLHKISINL